MSFLFAFSISTTTAPNIWSGIADRGTHAPVVGELKILQPLHQWGVEFPDTDLL